MSHEIDFSTGQAAIAYRGEVPWHGLGFSMPEDASLETWLKAAQLEWAVNRRPVTTIDLDGQKIPLDNHRALMRSDNNAVLSVVSDRYKVVQPVEVAEFFRDLCANNGYKIETMGALSGGKRVWALAKTGQSMKIGQDAVDGYLLLATSYDKTFATTAQFTAIRVVCNNTLTLTIANGEYQSEGIIRVPHVADFDAAQIKVDLGILAPAWEQFEGQANLLAETRVSKLDAIWFFMDLMGYPIDPNVPAESQARSIRLVTQLLEAYETSPGSQFPSAKDTAWGLMNAVSYFTDHARRALNAGSRLNSAWFGESSQLKKRALGKLLGMAQKVKDNT